jgi:hypothetical protein
MACLHYHIAFFDTAGFLFFLIQFLRLENDSERQQGEMGKGDGRLFDRFNGYWKNKMKNFITSARRVISEIIAGLMILLIAGMTVFWADTKASMQTVGILTISVGEIQKWRKDVMDSEIEYKHKRALADTAQIQMTREIRKELEDFRAENRKEHVKLTNWARINRKEILKLERAHPGMQPEDYPIE